MQQPYRVTFFKKLVDSTGHPFDVIQGAIELDASDDQSAMNRAGPAFAERKQVSNWLLRADYMNVEPLAASDQAGADGQERANRGRR